MLTVLGLLRLRHGNDRATVADHRMQAWTAESGPGYDVRRTDIDGGSAVPATISVAAPAIGVGAAQATTGAPIGESIQQLLVGQIGFNLLNLQTALGIHSRQVAALLPGLGAAEPAADAPDFSIAVLNKRGHEHLLVVVKANSEGMAKYAVLLRYVSLFSSQHSQAHKEINDIGQAHYAEDEIRAHNF
jgi:hypothetical protein